MNPIESALELSQPTIQPSVQTALSEDLDGLPGNDLTAQLISLEQQATASLIAREDCTLAGKAWFEAVFEQLVDAGYQAVSIVWNKQDGDRVTSNETVLTITGNARTIVSGERTAMNFLQTLSATATISARYADELRGTNCQLLDTRKTLPGLRAAQKYAVAVGGGYNHRIGLFDAFLIKENHIATIGGIEKAITSARTINSEVKVEIEVESLTELEIALEHAPDVIMLDNFSNDEMAAGVKLRDEIQPSVKLEASGNITLDNIRSVAETGVDYISVGAITKHIKAIDLSLLVKL